MAIGLAAPPPEKVPIESLTDAELVEQALSERVERAKNQKMSLKSLNPDKLWADYTVTNCSSGKTYRVALRGWERGESYCSCPDFRKNTLGTCKHILHVLDKMKSRFNKTVRETPYQIRSIAVYMNYGKDLELRLLVPENLDQQAMALLHPFKGKPVKDVRLDGSVPQKKRQGLIHQFQKDPECKLFITTNAGSTGLNLQAANTVINVYLPWNPAVLEQRIGRAHRMGQKKPVQIFLLVTENPLEESLLGTLSAKQALFLAALDPDTGYQNLGH